MDRILNVIEMLACALVVAACICRVDKMRASRQSWRWFAVYALFAAYACGTLRDSWRGETMRWDDAAGIGGLMLYMLLTRQRWQQGPPPETAKG